MNKGGALGADQIAELKQQAAERAVEWIESGMVVGLGSGTTATLAVRQIGKLIAAGRLRDIIALPTSAKVEAEARRLGIPLASFDNPPQIDITIDGADELDPALNMIKGGGGALLREKLVAQLSRREVIIVDQTKLSPKLGTHWPVPVEVIPFAWGAQARFLTQLGAKAVLRRRPDGSEYRTDQGNLIFDCAFGPLDNPHELAATLAARAGIVEHGLFLDMATDAVVAGPQGLQHLSRSR